MKDQNFSRFCALFSIFAFACCVVQGQRTSQGETLDSILQSNNISESESFRCGIFFAGKSIGAKPRLKIFILPKRFEATCSAAEPETYEKFCYNLFEGFSKFVSWETPSRRDPSNGRNIGDDLCKLLTIKAGFRKLPNKKFPEGVKVGFYYNYCNEKQWADTKFRANPNICCDGEKYVACP